MRGDADGLTKRQLLPATTVFRSRGLRRAAGPVEEALFAELRRGLAAAKFRHQAPFGPYHADFCSNAAKLIVEVDDATHAERTDSDAARTAFLNAEGVLAEIARNLPSELRGNCA